MRERAAAGAADPCYLGLDSPRERGAGLCEARALGGDERVDEARDRVAGGRLHDLRERLAGAQLALEL